MPIAVLVAGLLLALGVAGVSYMTFEKAEKLVESPAVQIGVIAGAILLLYIIYRQLSK